MSRLANCGLVALVILSAGCSAGTAVREDLGNLPGRYAITATVLAQRDASVVTLAHDAIKNYMPAMAMDFRGDSLPSLRAGDRIRATLIVTDDVTRLADVVVLQSSSLRPRGLRRKARSRAKTISTSRAPCNACSTRTDP